MNRGQQNLVLDWVAALLSGEYVHCKHRLYDAVNNRYSAEGVALKLAGFEPDDHGVFRFQTDGTIGRHITIVPSRWFDERFGLPRPVGVYSAMNDRTENYLAVVALLLNAVPDNTPRKIDLHRQLQEKANAGRRV